MRRELERAGVADALCCVCNVSKWGADGLVMGMVRAL